MSDRNRYPSRANGAGRVFVDFELLGAGAAALTASTDATQALAATGAITRSGTGVFVVKLRDTFSKVVSAKAEPDDTLDDGARATIGTITNEGTATPLQFTLTFRDASGTKADPAAARRIWVRLALRNGSGWGIV